MGLFRGPGYEDLKAMESCEICGISVMRLRRPWFRRHRVLPESVSLCPACWDDLEPRTPLQIKSIHAERIDD